MKKYMNRRGNGYRETVDELDSADFPSMREFYAECRRLLDEYRRSDPAADYRWSSQLVRRVEGLSCETGKTLLRALRQRGRAPGGGTRA